MTKSSAAITWVAVPFSSNLIKYSLLLTLIVTLPVPLTTFTITVPLEPGKTASAVTVMIALGLLFSTILFSLALLTAASPLYKLAVK